MRKKRKEKVIINKIEIIDITDKGKSVAKQNGRVIFVEDVIPGDICDVRVVKKRRKYWTAKVEKIHTFSANRTDPKCEHFGVCGGCKWQHMKYDAQLRFKEKKVIENLRRISGASLPKNNTIIASEDQYYYEIKLGPLKTEIQNRVLEIDSSKEVLSSCLIPYANQ